jgi:hypothetical protein
VSIHQPISKATATIKYWDRLFADPIKAKNAPEKIPAKIKRLIAGPEFLETIARLFKKPAWQAEI